METADISIHSALTGHLVFSTLHTNDAPGAVTRLLDMGIEGFLVSSSLIGVLAQRLVRVICPSCKEPFSPPPQLLEKIGPSLEGVASYHGTGCGSCRQTGYRGRIGIFELMMVDEDIRRMVIERAGSNIIRDKAVASGMLTLAESGWQKVRDGVTTI
jgi:type II secretory ATPase GspE/PulE/Tfp pilus assembly ATPase PilB-like protein